jgi:hypothetical protein
MAKVPLCRCKCRKLPLQQVQLPLHCFALPQAATDCRYQLFLSMQLPRKPAAISYVAVSLPLPHMVLQPSTVYGCQHCRRCPILALMLPLLQLES